MWGGRKAGFAAAFLVSMASVLLCPGTARAATDEELFRELRFNLTHPGGRALGLGGAFVALADDATAAQANPAGLYAIGRYQAFVEYRVVDRDPIVVSSESGSLTVDPVSGDRDLPFLGVTNVSEPETSSEPSFASLAIPLRLGRSDKPFALFVSRQVLLDDERSLSFSGLGTESRASFESYPNTVSAGVVEAYSVDRSVTGAGTMEIDSYSAGAAFGIHPDFAIGVTLTLARLDVRAETISQTVDPLGLVLDPAHPRLPSQPTSDLFRSALDGTDSAFAYTVGIHWHPDSVISSGKSPWRLGAAVHKGAGFKTTQTVFLNDTVDEVFTNEITVPDRYSVGVVYDYRERWTFAFEFERIEFSDMLEGFRAGVNPLTSERFAQGSFSIDPAREIRYTVDDANVPHVGVEYRRPSRGDGPDGAVFRAGYYLEADSRIRMASFNSTDPVVDQVYLEAFSGGDDVNHFTAGFGYGFGRYDFRLTGDFSDEGTEAVAGVTIDWGEQ